eukprot:TRINITY_DN8046_c0_g1_i7.p1 TRINITY_DN8046_c0_g1~~TRINITY_DN8046_c0_g1_i7.p1  ORF type:complete len:493 (+),score=95.33 TRINITY_DN8046_c0_g1_i7:189-1667(+)
MESIWIELNDWSETLGEALMFTDNKLCQGLQIRTRTSDIVHAIVLDVWGQFHWLDSVWKADRLLGCSSLQQGSNPPPRRVLCVTERTQPFLSVVQSERLDRNTTLLWSREDMIVVFDWQTKIVYWRHPAMLMTVSATDVDLRLLQYRYPEDTFRCRSNPAGSVSVICTSRELPHTSEASVCLSAAVGSVRSALRSCVSEYGAALTPDVCKTWFAAGASRPSAPARETCVGAENECEKLGRAYRALRDCERVIAGVSDDCLRALEWGLYGKDAACSALVTIARAFSSCSALHSLPEHSQAPEGGSEMWRPVRSLTPLCDAISLGHDAPPDMVRLCSATTPAAVAPSAFELSQIVEEAEREPSPPASSDSGGAAQEPPPPDAGTDAPDRSDDDAAADVASLASLTSMLRSHAAVFPFNAPSPATPPAAAADAAARADTPEQRRGCSEAPTETLDECVVVVRSVEECRKFFGLEHKRRVESAVRSAKRRRSARMV